MSTMGSHPYNQGEKHPSMERDHDDRVHSGGLPTITVPSIVLASQWRGHSPGSTLYKHGESHQGQSGRKSRVAEHRHLVLFGM
jgi:hypothetical protein